MKNNPLLFFFGVLVLLSISCGGQQPMIVELKPCQGPEVTSWLEDTFQRIDKAYNSTELTTEELERIYQSQQNQVTHVCMTQAQEFAVGIFYHELQATYAIEQGDSNKSLDQFMQAKDSYDKMVIELKRLSEEYAWGYDW